MSATSGIGLSSDLRDVFSAAVDSQSVRFIKVSVHNELLVHDTSINTSGTLEDDLKTLQTVLDDHIPAYVLARMDEPPSDWLAISYVPDSAKVRDKMLYASTRNSLTKSLGSTHFTDSMFATSKSDITPEAYAAHKRHIAAPKPMSAREKEMADIKAAERDGGTTYQGSRARQNHVGTGVGLNWSKDVEDAVERLGNGEGSSLIVLTIDPASETLLLSTSGEQTVEELAEALPSSEPCYALFAWPHSYTSPPRREIVFIYSCPSSSPIKHRMLYSSGSSSVFQTAKSLLSSSTVASRKVETSDPKELNEDYLKSELGLGVAGDASGAGAASGVDAMKPKDGGFSRPKGPGRRR